MSPPSDWLKHVSCESCDFVLVVHDQDRIGGRHGNGHAIRAGDPLVDLVAGKSKDRGFDLEDERPCLDPNLGTVKDAAFVREAKEPPPPFRGRLLAQGDAPDG